MKLTDNALMKLINKQSSKVGVIIPAYNEVQTIGKTVSTLKKIEIITDILVVDDGSQDNTIDIARKNGARTIRIPKNMGKAHALKKGMDELDSEIIVFLDADIGQTAIECRKLIKPIIDNIADITIAKFKNTPGAGGIGLVKGLSRGGLKLLTGQDCISVLSGQRAFRRDKINKDISKYKGFGVEFGMTIDMIKQGSRIMEIEVNMLHRLTGKDINGYMHRFRQFVDILIVIINKTIEEIFNNDMKRRIC